MGHIYKSIDVTHHVNETEDTNLVISVDAEKAFDRTHPPCLPGMCVSVAQPCPTRCSPVGYSPPGSAVRAVLQARVLEGG